MGVVLLDPAAYFEGVFMSSDDVTESWKQAVAPADKETMTVAEAYAPATPATPEGSGAASAPAATESASVAVAANDASVTAPSKPEQSIFPKVQPEPVFTLPKVKRVPGVAFAAAPISVPQPAGQQSSLTMEALNRKQEELMRKEQDLKALQEELEQRFVQMQELEMRLQIMLRDAEEIKDARYRQLVDVLANMKARQAAEVLSTLDEKVAVRVLAGMRGRQAGEILSFADPIKAARLTEALARMQMPLQ
ncbi:hypothetical protein LJC48_01880 [Desulfovibrio sp. OttesenSCG-928-C06]|nr:hypothetical protein [Desulfovibrio sp. OttesenSCG-928-C06]